MRKSLFLAGACLSTLPRQRVIPGRVFYDFDGFTPKDPMDVFVDSGFNSVRVLTSRDQPLTTNSFDNDGDVVRREQNFELDLGGIDLQVKLALQATQKNMTIIHTINMGQDIPLEWQNYSYKEMLQQIDAETKRQITPFLEAGVQPDIILLENEGTDGFLFQVNTTNGQVHNRGILDGGIDQGTLEKELRGIIPTGNIACYPQLAGYYKQEILTAKRLLCQYNLDLGKTRFGLHTHGQYFQFKQDVVYSEDENAETEYSNGNIHYNYTNIIPKHLLNRRASKELDIIGYSGYPDPMAPNGTSNEALEATFDRLQSILAYSKPLVELYGRRTCGPFAGQYKKQLLSVEYASRFSLGQEDIQINHINMLFNIVKQYEWYLGVLWWEPTYVFNNWEGGEATQYRAWFKGSGTMAAPKNTVVTWGNNAQS